MGKSIVSIVEGTDLDEMVEEAVSLLGGIGALIKPNSTVVVKPNAGHDYPPETSVNTSPAVVAAAIRELRKARPREIILAEAAAIGCDTLRCLEVSGIGTTVSGAKSVRHCRRQLKRIVERSEINRCWSRPTKSIKKE
jgi:uncharacterized protein (DUF362 family)